MKESKAPKMQLYSLHIFKWVHENPILLTSAYDVSKLWYAILFTNTFILVIKCLCV